MQLTETTCLIQLWTRTVLFTLRVQKVESARLKLAHSQSHLKCSCNRAILFKTIQYHVVPSSTVHYQTLTCNTKQYHAIPCSTMQYLVILCYTMRDLAIPCSTMQYTVLPCNTVPYHAIPSAPCNIMP